jgi:hypothetical protein
VNISPHHQKPTKYPWPGLASRAFLVVGILVLAVIALLLIGSFVTPDDAAPSPTAMRALASPA